MFEAKAVSWKEPNAVTLYCAIASMECHNIAGNIACMLLLVVNHVYHCLLMVLVSDQLTFTTFTLISFLPHFDTHFESHFDHLQHLLCPKMHCVAPIYVAI